MSLPAVASPAPIAVLVLAWDEAIPAVRALVEATEASTPPLDSLLVLVPQADAPDGLSAEEYLPLPADLPELAAPAAQVPAPVAELPAPAEALDAPDSPPTNTIEHEAYSAESAEYATLPNPASPPSQPAPPIWAAVRVLRLGSLNPPPTRPDRPLPAPIWAGAVAIPAAPYVGATEPEQAIPKQEEMPAGAAPAPMPGLSTVLAGLPATSATLAAEPLPTTDFDSSAATVPAAPTYSLPESPPQAADLETDLALAETADLIDAETSEADFPLADEFLLDTENTPGLTTPDAPPLSTPQPEAFVVESPEPTATPSLSPAHEALRPANQHYPAPDLNYQIIQYARLAVPLALAEPEFAAIYAPAWPTWLAAQELRQRTGQPLVLHVAALAATETESIDKAAGWVAELQRQALRRADLILAETPALAQRLRRELGLHYGMVLTIPAAEAEAVAQALREAQPKPATW